MVIFSERRKTLRDLTWFDMQEICHHIGRCDECPLHMKTSEIDVCAKKVCDWMELKAYSKERKENDTGRKGENEGRDD